MNTNASHRNRLFIVCLRRIECASFFLAVASAVVVVWLYKELCAWESERNSWKKKQRYIQLSKVKSIEHGCFCTAPFVMPSIRTPKLFAGKINFHSVLLRACVSTCVWSIRLDANGFCSMSTAPTHWTHSLNWLSHSSYLSVVLSD